MSNLLDYLEKPTKPVSKFIEWSGSEGRFKYYNKEKNENIVMDEPLYFIIIEKVNAITGFSKEKQCGIYSNEIANISKDILNVCYFKGGLQVSGLYKDKKGEIMSMGGKFENVIYSTLFIKDKEPEIVAFKLFGSALNSYIDAKLQINGSIIKVQQNPEKQKNGAVYYFIPEFTVFGNNVKWLDIAKKHAQILKEYREQYANYQRNVAESITSQVEREMMATQENTTLNDINEEIKNRNKLPLIDLDTKEVSENDPFGENENNLPF